MFSNADENNQKEQQSIAALSVEIPDDDSSDFFIEGELDNKHPSPDAKTIRFLNRRNRFFQNSAYISTPSTDSPDASTVISSVSSLDSIERNRIPKPR